VVDFGDGTAPQVGTTTYHIYKAAGTFPVKVTVTDNRGATATTTSSVTAH
jgi:PKD repeat protein